MTGEPRPKLVYLNDTKPLAYLESRGIKVSRSFMKDARFRGRGPRVVYVGRNAMSCEEWLDAWIDTVLIKLKHPRHVAAEQRQSSMLGHNGGPTLDEPEQQPAGKPKRPPPRKRKPAKDEARAD